MQFEKFKIFALFSERIPLEKQVEASSSRWPALAQLATCFREHATGSRSAHVHQVRLLICLAPESQCKGTITYLPNKIRSTKWFSKRACIFFRNRDTCRDEFIFYSKRLMRLLIEFALSLLPFKVCFS